MFTGIVEEIGKVLSVSGRRLTFSAGTALEGTRSGDSIAVNGVCLTVIHLTQEAFTVEVSPETLKRTNLNELRRDAQVHLERAVQPTSRMGGHFVQGHVDGLGRISGFKTDENALWMTVEAEPELLRYIVPKGFVALDGVSLTSVEVAEGHFTVTLVPFTRQKTMLAHRPVGYKVNIEVDILGKYVEQFLNQKSSGHPMTMDFLTEHGFR